MTKIKITTVITILFVTVGWGLCAQQPLSKAKTNYIEMDLPKTWDEAIEQSFFQLTAADYKYYSDEEIGMYLRGVNDTLLYIYSLTAEPSDNPGMTISDINHCINSFFGWMYHYQELGYIVTPDFLGRIFREKYIDVYPELLEAPMPLMAVFCVPESQIITTIINVLGGLR